MTVLPIGGIIDWNWTQRSLVDKLHLIINLEIQLSITHTKFAEPNDYLVIRIFVTGTNTPGTFTHQQGA